MTVNFRNKEIEIDNNRRWYMNEHTFYYKFYMYEIEVFKAHEMNNAYGFAVFCLSKDNFLKCDYQYCQSVEDGVQQAFNAISRDIDRLQIERARIDNWLEELNDYV